MSNRSNAPTRKLNLERSVNPLRRLMDRETLLGDVMNHDSDENFHTRATEPVHGMVGTNARVLRESKHRV